MRILPALFAALGLAMAQGTLQLYTWTDYIDPSIVRDFEKETGLKVRITYYESNEEMQAKLQAGGVSQFDLVLKLRNPAKKTIE